MIASDLIVKKGLGFVLVLQFGTALKDQFFLFLFFVLEDFELIIRKNLNSNYNLVCERLKCE